MAVIQAILPLALLATLASAEPPVLHDTSGYSYNAPSSNYAAPSGHYGTPSADFSAPSTGYGVPSPSYHTPSTGYGAPSSGGYNGGYNGNGGHGSGGHGGDGDNGHDHHDNGEPKAYEFGYSVKDAHSGNDYDRKEVSDGNTVRGEYRVQLPDGRVQIVSYHADWQTGFHADVRYEGEAKYPEQTASYNHNAQAGGAHAGNYAAPATGYGAPAHDSYNGYNNQQSNQFSGGLTGFGSGHGSTGYDSYALPGTGASIPNTVYGTPYHH